jgi:hypothetical protein
LVRKIWSLIDEMSDSLGPQVSAMADRIELANSSMLRFENSETTYGQWMPEVMFGFEGTFVIQSLRNTSLHPTR